MVFEHTSDGGQRGGIQARVEEQQFGAALQESTQGCGVAHLDDSVVRVEGGADLLQKTCGGGE